MMNCSLARARPGLRHSLEPRRLLELLHLEEVSVRACVLGWEP